MSARERLRRPRRGRRAPRAQIQPDPTRRFEPFMPEARVPSGSPSSARRRHSLGVCPRRGARGGRNRRRKDYKGKDADLVYKVDTGLLAELRNHEAGGRGIGAVEREAGTARGRVANRDDDHLRALAPVAGERAEAVARRSAEDRMNARSPSKLKACSNRTVTRFCTVSRGLLSGERAASPVSPRPSRPTRTMRGRSRAGFEPFVAVVAWARAGVGSAGRRRSLNVCRRPGARRSAESGDARRHVAHFV